MLPPLEKFAGAGAAHPKRSPSTAGSAASEGAETSGSNLVAPPRHAGYIERPARSRIMSARPFVLSGQILECEINPIRAGWGQGRGFGHGMGSSLLGLSHGELAGD